jgi:thymidine phosphorylase
VAAPQSGTVAAIDARALGEAVVALGGGRARKEDTIDPAVGIMVSASVGTHVDAGDTLVYIHASTPADLETARLRVLAAYQITSSEAPAPPLILGVLAA